MMLLRVLRDTWSYHVTSSIYPSLPQRDTVQEVFTRLYYVDSVSPSGALRSCGDFVSIGLGRGI